MQLVQTGITGLKRTCSSLHQWAPTVLRPGIGRQFRPGRTRGKAQRVGTPERHRVLLMWYLCNSDTNDDGYYRLPASPPAAVARFDADLSAWNASYAKRGSANFRGAILQSPSLVGCPQAALLKTPGGVMPNGITYYRLPNLNDNLARFKQDYAAVTAGMHGAPTKVIIQWWASGFSQATIQQCCDWLKDAKKCDWIYYSFLGGGYFWVVYRWIYSFYQLAEHHAFNYQMTDYP